MLYSNLSELPTDVRSSLPEPAQELYRRTFNAVAKKFGGDEQRASSAAQSAAWTAVKKRYKPSDDGKWVEVPQRAQESRVQEWFPSGSIEPLDDGDYRIHFLAHGFTADKRRYYPVHVLESAASGGTFDGVKMYLNHEDLTQRGGRIHRDLRDWGATIKAGTVRVVEGGPGGYVLEAVCHAHLPAARAILDDPIAKASVGLSHDSLVTMTQKRIDGVETNVVETIKRCNSVDLVPEGNASGRVMEAAPEQEADEMDLTTLTLDELREARPDLVDQLTVSTTPPEVPETQTQEAKPPTPPPPAPQVVALTESQVQEAVQRGQMPLLERIKVLEDEKAAGLTMENVQRIVEARSDLATSVKSRVLESFRGQIIPTDQLMQRVTEACDREREYALIIARELGGGTKIRGLGSAPTSSQTPEQVRESYDAGLVERMEQMGYTPKQIEQMKAIGN